LINGDELAMNGLVLPGDGEPHRSQRDTQLGRGGEGNEVEEGERCLVCGKLYQTKRGLGVHMASKHKEERNAEIKADDDCKTKRRWCDQDKLLLARYEAGLKIQGIKPKDINAHLYEKFPERSTEAVKGRRRQKDHKELVVAEIVKLSLPIAIAPNEQPVVEDGNLDGLEIPGQRVETPNAGPAVRGEDLTALPPEDMAVGMDDIQVAENVDVYEYCEMMKLIFADESEFLGHLVDPSEADGLCKDRARIDEWVQTKLNEWIGWTGIPRVSAAKGRQIQEAPKNRAEKRARLRQLTQSRYEKNPTDCIRAILSETLQTEDTIGKEELHQFWGAIFGKTPVGIEPIDTVNKPVDKTLAQPITIDEVEAGLKRLKNSSAGPDGIKRSDVLGIPKHQLKLMLNVFQATRYTPKFLRLGNVTLVPKTSKPETAGQYRPITVTSFLLRLYHGIIARRYDSLPLSKRQKAFLPRDGIAENVWILDMILKVSKFELRDIYLVFVDVAKAFDSLAHTSLLQAARRIGIPQSQLDYIELVYAEAEMRFKGNEENIRQTCGVRQGCQKSAPLFDAAIDMCYAKLDPELGFMVKDPTNILGNNANDPSVFKLTDIQFADDGISVSGSKRGSIENTGVLVKNLAKCGMKLNPTKCATLAIKANGRRKAMFVENAPYLKIDGVDVPAKTIGETYKYLGLKIGSEGYSLKTISKDLVKNLDLLTKASLKPKQRLNALKQNIIPGLLHSLVLVFCPMQQLINMDKTIRRYTRKWLKLQSDTPLGMFHARIMDGGLGIPSLHTRVPRLRRERLSKLRKSDDPLVKILIEHPVGQRELVRSTAIKSLGDVQIFCKNSEAKAWQEKLHQSADGRGLTRHGKAYDGWLTDNGVAVKSGEFVRAIRVRCNAMRTPARATRGDRGDPNCRWDRQVANSNHVSQVCQQTHGLRVIRHDEMCKTLRVGLQKAGYRVILEPKIQDGNTFVKPDIICWKGKRGFVLDPIICGDNVDPNDRIMEKKEKYSRDIVFDYVKERGAENGAVLSDGVEAHGISLTFRGSWAAESVQLLKVLGVAPSLGTIITLRVLNASWRLLYTYDKTSFGRRRLY
jgi:hypothetical protein